MNYAGKFDAKFSADGSGPHAAAHVDTFSAHASHAPAGAIIVPDAQLLFNGDFKREGVDLVLSRDDHELVLHDYFKGEKRAALSSPDGAHLTGALVDALTGHTEYAQAAGNAAAGTVIGHVTKLTGSATATRNGVSIVLNQGDNVEKGDVVQSGSDSTLGITFIDGTVFGLSSNARMVLNEMVYDPNGSSNSSLMSLVAGTISFVAGETAKHGDMKIDTPVATMGIRGTAVLVEIDFNIPGASDAPDAKFQVLVEPDGSTGSYILFDKNTLTPIAEVNKAGQQIKISHGLVSISNEALAPDVQKLITDVFTQKFTDNSNTKTFDHFTDTIVPQALAPVTVASGPIATPVVLLVKSADNGSGPGSGGPSDKLEHIDGPPHAVVLNLAAQPANGFQVTELAGTTGDVADLDKVSGIVTFVDINAGDTPTVSTAFSSFSYHSAAGTPVTLNARQLADVVAVEVKLGLVPDHGNNNTGFATWTYSVPDNAFDFLAAGETLQLTYQARVDNNYAPNDEATILSFTITVTGTNDVPVITAPAPTIAFSGGTSVPGGNLTPDVATSGTLSFADVDLTDTHTVSAKLTGAVGVLHGVTVLNGLNQIPPGPLDLFEQAVTASIAAGHDSTGTGTGTINWSLADLPVYIADFIPKDETLTLTYTVTLTDSQGATATQNVIVTITGTDAPAVVWIATTQNGSTGGVWSDASNWETGTVPTITDDAIVITDQLHGLTPSFPVTITQVASAKSLTMNDFGTTPPEVINKSTLTISGALNMSADSIVQNMGTLTVGGLAEILNKSVLDNSGTIKLGDGGDFSNQSQIGNSGTIEVAGGTLNLAVGVDNAGGTMTVDGPAKVTLTGAIINSGTVSNSGEIDFNGNAVLKDGFLGNAGQLKVSGVGNALHDETVTANHALEVLGNSALLLDLDTHVTNGGTITVDSTGTLTLNSAAVTGGTLTDNGTLDLTGTAVLKNGSLGNSGQINVSGSGNALDKETITSTGNIDVSGALTIDHVSTLDNTGGGSITIDSTGTLTLNDATVTGGTLADNGTLALTGTAVLKNGSLGNSGHINVSGSGNALDKETITSTGNIDVSGALTIDQVSTLDNTGGGSITVDSTGTLTLNSATVTGGTLTDNGTLDLTGTAVLKNGSLGNAHQINVSGSGNALDKETITSTGNIDVSGALTIDQVSTLDNTGGGSITIDSTGTLTLNDATVTGGTLADNGTLDLTGTAVLKNGSLGNSGQINVSGSGNEFYDETVTANHALEILTGGALAIDQGSQVSNTGLTIDSGGTLTLNDATVTGGTLTDNGTLDLTGTAVLKNGSLGNSGQINVSGSGNEFYDETVTANHALEILTGGALAIDQGSQVSNTGLTIDSGGTLTLNDAIITGGTVGNSGTLNSTGTSAITNATIANSGTIESTGGTLTIDPVAGPTITNSGTIEANGGELDITSDPVGNTGTLKATDNSTLKLSSLTVTNTGAGTVTVDSGSTLDLISAIITGGTVGNSGTLDSTGTSSITAAITNSDTIEATAGKLTLTGSAITNSGTIEANGGELDITSDPVGNTGTLKATDNSTLKLSSLTVTNTGAGTVTVDSGSTLDLVSAIITGGTVGNSGTLNSTGTSSITAGITNSDTIEATGGKLTLTGSAITNSGTIEANGGELDITSDPVGNTGTLKATDDSTLKLSSLTVTNTGAGTVTVDSGSTLDLVSAIITGGTVGNSGTLDSTGTSSITAALTNSDTIEATAGKLTLTGSAITNSGTIEANGGELDITSDAIGNTGTLKATDDSTLKLSSLTVTNTGSGTVTVDLGSTLDLIDSHINGGSLGNSGTLDSTGTSAIGAGTTVTNSGTIEAPSGTLTIDGNITNTGTLEANGGTLVIGADAIISGSAATVTIAGGLVEFVGSTSQTLSLNANFSGAGTLELDNGQHFGGTVSGFSAGDIIKLDDLVYSASETDVWDSLSHTLTITSGSLTESLTLSGNYNQNNFALTQDASHHTELVWSPAQASLSGLDGAGNTVAGYTLTAGLTDVHASGITYTWVEDGQTVQTGSSDSFTPGVADEGKVLDVVVGFTDGSTEQLTAVAGKVAAPPSVTSDAGTVTTGEGVALTLSGLKVSFADAGSDTVTATLDVVHGALSLSNTADVAGTGAGTVASPLILTGTLVQIDAALTDGVIYTPSTAYVGSDTLTVNAQAGVFSSNTASVDISVQGPQFQGYTLTVSEGGTTVLSNSDFNVSESGVTNFIYSVQNVTHGDFEVFNGTNWAAATADGFSTAQIAAGHVRFVQNGDDAAPTFTIQAGDGSNVSPAIAPTVNFSDAPVISTGNIVLANASALGTPGVHQGAAVSYADGHLYLSFNNGPANYDTSDTASVFGFNTEPSGVSGSTFAYGWSKGDLFGLVADGNQIYTVGESHPGYGLTTDGVGSDETKAIFVRFHDDGTAGSGPSSSEGDTAHNFFSYTGSESFNNVIATDQSGQTLLYAVGTGQPESYDAYIVAEYDAAGDLLAEVTDSSVGVTFSDLNGEPTPGSSAANDAVYINNDLWVLGSTAWPTDNGGATNSQAVVWEYDSNLNLLGRFKDADASLTGHDAAFTGGAMLGNSLYAVGHVSTAGGGQNYLIADYNSDGSIAWTANFGDGGTDTLTGAVSLNGHLYVIGSTTHGGVGSEGVLMEIDPSSGHVLSTIAYDASQYSSFTSVTTDGEHLFVAGVAGPSASQEQPVLLTYDVGAPITTTEDTAVAMHSLAVSDVAAGSSQIEVTLAVAHGTLALENSAGLDLVVNAGTGSVELFGSQAAIDVALAHGVVYDPSANFTGTDTLTITADDQGHNASGVAQSIVQDLSISIAPAVSIADGATDTVSGPSGDTIAFATGNGTLALTQPSTFTGEIAGITGSGDVLDLDGFAAATTTAATGNGSFDSVSNTTTLTVTDSSNHLTETLKLVGDLSGSTWNVTTDNNGGVNIVDPPASQTVTATAPNQTLTGDSAGTTYVFNFAGIGKDIITDFHPLADTLQFGGATFANAQAALDATQDDGHGNTIIALDAHDAITLSGVLKAQLHAADFHFV